MTTQQLKEKTFSENFEKAAKLRDTIKDLQRTKSIIDRAIETEEPAALIVGMDHVFINENTKQLLPQISEDLNKQIDKAQEAQDNILQTFGNAKDAA